MKKSLLWLLPMLALSLGVRGQVLGGSSTYGYNSGLSIGVGTYASNGRSFWVDNANFDKVAVDPEGYHPRLFNPIFGVSWWAEIPNDNFVYGYHVMGNYGEEQYKVDFGTNSWSVRLKTVGLSAGGYIGWHFGDRLTACAGLQLEARYPIGKGGQLNIFSAQTAIGVMAMVRYAIWEEYFLSLTGSYGLFPLGDLDLDWERYNPVGDGGLYVVDSDLKTFTLMVGIGRGF